MSKKKSVTLLSIIAVIIALVATFSFVKFESGIYDYNSIAGTIISGMDLNGTIYNVYEPDLTDVADEDVQKTIADTIQSLRTRFDALGITDVSLNVQDGNNIKIEIPSESTAEQALTQFVKPGHFTFQDKSGTVYLSEAYISDAVFYSNNGSYVFAVQFNSAGTSILSTASSTIASSSDDTNMYIYMDGTQILQVSVTTQITNGVLGASGVSTSLMYNAIIAKNGVLPAEINSVGNAYGAETFIGKTAVNLLWLAIAIGVVLISVLLIVRYRGFGIAATVSLCGFFVLYIVALAIVPGAQLSVPTLIGMILSIALTTDGLVFVYEKIKDEFAHDKTFETSIKNGYQRALYPLMDAHVILAIVALVVWIAGLGIVTDFGCALFIGVVLSAFATFLFNKWMISIISPLAEDKIRFFNIKREDN